LLAQAGTIAAQLGLVVGAAFFMLVDGDALLGRLFRLVPRLPDDRRATIVINEVGARMSSYLGAVTLVNLGLGLTLGVCLGLLRMPNPWLWGGLAAVLTYVPYLGPAVGIGLVTLASFVTFPTLGTAIVPPAVYLALASIEGNLVTPFVLGRTCAVRPLVIFVWLALWAWLWSVPGAILAVPLLMLLRFVCDETPALAPVAFLMRR
jgi:predicted PurR-regulated permease PerM